MSSLARLRRPRLATRSSFERTAWIVRVVTALAAAPLIAQAAPCQDEIPWQTDLAAAQQLAAAENKLLLVHFWGDFCRPCLNVERFVFTNPAVQQAIAGSYIPVKVDVTAHPELATKFGIETVPHDVILAPGGGMLTKRSSPSSSDGYRRMIDQVARAAERTNPSTLAAAEGVAKSVAVTGTENVRSFLPADQSSITPQPLQWLESGGDAGIRQVADQSVARLSESGIDPPPGTESLSPTPSLGGFCPVTLLSTEQWVAGDRQWGCRHRGKTYWFVSREARDQFRVSPDLYSPMLAGFDAVEYAESGELIEGGLEHMLLVSVGPRQQLYLFRSAENKARFAADPQPFVKEVRAAMRAADAAPILR